MENIKEKRMHYKVTYGFADELDNLFVEIFTSRKEALDFINELKNSNYDYFNLLIKEIDSSYILDKNKGE